MPATRLMPSEEASDLIALTRDIVAKELAPKVAQIEASGEFPREVFRTLGRAGLLSLPYPEEFGGGGQPYEVYLQVLEEIAAVSASVGVGVSVHALSCFGLFTAGTDEQRKQWLPEMLSGEQLGAYCLSEAHAGSDPAAMRRVRSATATRTCSTVRRRGRRMAARPTSTRSWPVRPMTAAAGSPASWCRRTRLD